MHNDKEYREIFESFDCDKQVRMDIIEHRFRIMKTKIRVLSLEPPDKSEAWRRFCALWTLSGVYECVGLESVSVEARS